MRVIFSSIIRAPESQNCTTRCEPSLSPWAVSFKCSSTRPSVPFSFKADEPASPDLPMRTLPGLASPQTKIHSDVRVSEYPQYLSFRPFTSSTEDFVRSSSKTFFPINELLQYPHDFVTRRHKTMEERY